MMPIPPRPIDKLAIGQRLIRRETGGARIVVEIDLEKEIVGTVSAFDWDRGQTEATDRRGMGSFRVAK